MVSPSCSPCTAECKMGKEEASITRSQSVHMLTETIPIGGESSVIDRAHQCATFPSWTTQRTGGLRRMWKSCAEKKDWRSCDCPPNIHSYDPTTMN